MVSVKCGVLVYCRKSNNVISSLLWHSDQVLGPKWFWISAVVCECDFSSVIYTLFSFYLIEIDFDSKIILYISFVFASLIVTFYIHVSSEARLFTSPVLAWYMPQQTIAGNFTSWMP